jgi:hypothetical protein
MTLIANRYIRENVDKKTVFSNNTGSVFSRWMGTGEDRRYVVYSYNDGWPMYIWVPHLGTWFGVAEKISVTTSKHTNLARPSGVTVTPISRHKAIVLAQLGTLEMVTREIARAAA